jgi:tetratricopeptide (TPR) repeat protein
VYRFIEDDKLIVIFSNVRPCEVYFLADNITNVLYAKPVKIPKHSLVARFAATTERSDVATAVADYYRIREQAGNDYELNGSDFNLLGYTYMRKGRLKDALAVFKINVEAYPGFADPYDSIAEAYMKMGNTEQAIFNYRKSLELDPNNSNAKVMLKKLESK